jgi:hypothetical protein
MRIVKATFPLLQKSQIKNWCCRKAIAAKRIIKLQQSLLKWKIRTSHSRVKLTHIYSPFDAHTPGKRNAPFVAQRAYAVQTQCRVQFARAHLLQKTEKVRLCRETPSCFICFGSRERTNPEDPGVFNVQPRPQ